MAKSRVFWITKDNDYSGDGEIWIWQYTCHPQMDKDGIWGMPDERSDRSGPEHEHEKLPMCNDGFAELTGITLKPGQRIKKRLVDA